MALCIDTFSNSDGGFPFFKAAGHPASAPQIKELLNRLSKANKVAIYDPLGFASGFFEIYSSSENNNCRCVCTGSKKYRKTEYSDACRSL